MSILTLEFISIMYYINEIAVIRSPTNLFPLSLYIHFVWEIWSQNEYLFC